MTGVDSIQIVSKSLSLHKREFERRNDSERCEKAMDQTTEDRKLRQKAKQPLDSNVDYKLSCL